MNKIKIKCISAVSIAVLFFISGSCAKTINNVNMGYSMQLPENWAKKETASIDTLLKKKEAGLNIIFPPEISGFSLNNIDIFTSDVSDSIIPTFSILRVDSVLKLDKSFISQIRAQLPTRLKNMGLTFPMVSEILKKKTSNSEAMVVKVEYSVNKRKLGNLIGYLPYKKHYYILFFMVPLKDLQANQSVFYNALETFNSLEQTQDPWKGVKSKGVFIVILLALFVALFLRTLKRRKS
jgi:hypothetical protein